MKNKKLLIVGVVVVVIAAAVIILSKFAPTAKNSDSAGTIGVVKKYSAKQMSEKDVKLKNIMLKDTASIKKSIEQLKVYKSFILGLAVDMGKWDEAIADSKSKNPKGLKDEKVLNDNSALYAEYKKYIEKNTSIIDNTIELLTRLKNGSDADRSQNYEAALTDYENFRIQVAQKFEKVISSLPKVHNAFVKNGMKGMIGSKDGYVGCFVYQQKENMGVTATENTVFNKDLAIGVVLMKDATNCYVYQNKDASYQLVVTNKELQSKDIAGSTVTFSKDGFLNMDNLGTSFVAAYYCCMKEGAQGIIIIANKDVASGMKDNSLEMVLNKEVAFGVALNKDNSIANVIGNTALGYVDPVE